MAQLARFLLLRTSNDLIGLFTAGAANYCTLFIFASDWRQMGAASYGSNFK
jgi:hypothetical protein